MSTDDFIIGLFIRVDTIMANQGNRVTFFFDSWGCFPT